MAKKTTTKAPSRKSRTAKKASSQKTSTTRSPRSASSTDSDEPVMIDRRNLSERRQSEPEPSPPKLERREKVQRRRQIDPTTCERDYSDEEVEFMNALDEYKRTSGRMFPTCSEVLEVIRGLGYAKLTPTEFAARELADDGDEDRASDADEDSISISQSLHMTAVSATRRLRQKMISSSDSHARRTDCGSMLRPLSVA